MKSLVIFLFKFSLILADCPNKRFLELHVCDYCSDWTEVRLERGEVKV